jgi:hypothetical protein
VAESERCRCEGDEKKEKHNTQSVLACLATLFCSSVACALFLVSGLCLVVSCSLCVVCCLKNKETYTNELNDFEKKTSGDSRECGQQNATPNAHRHTNR